MAVTFTCLHSLSRCSRPNLPITSNFSKLILRSKHSPFQFRGLYIGIVQCPKMCRDSTSRRVWRKGGRAARPTAKLSERIMAVSAASWRRRKCCPGWALWICRAVGCCHCQYASSLLLFCCCCCHSFFDCVLCCVWKCREVSRGVALSAKLSRSVAVECRSRYVYVCVARNFIGIKKIQRMRFLKIANFEVGPTKILLSCCSSASGSRRFPAFNNFYLCVIIFSWILLLHRKAESLFK